MQTLKLGLIYFKDVEVKNIEEYAMKNNPYIALYSKINL